jgi:iron complex transport system substrate-binding protein
MRNPRVVSLIASSTEMVVALGRGEWLVGRSHECDHPEWVRALPAVTSPKFATDGASYQIDERVRAILEDAISVYHVDADALAELRPDVILTQTQCAVCAVSPRDLEAAACERLPSQPRIVALEPNALDDLWRDLALVAEALDAKGRGLALRQALEDRMRAIASAAARRPRPTVALIEWIAPLMAAGNWHPELIEMAGGTDPFGRAGVHAPRLSWERLVAVDPDVLVVAPCGFGLQRTRSEMGELTRLEGWSRLSAVRMGRVFLADGNAYFNRPGPRVVETLEILAEILQPDVFRFGHESRGYVRFE